LSRFSFPNLPVLQTVKKTLKNTKAYPGPKGFLSLFFLLENKNSGIESVAIIILTVVLVGMGKGAVSSFFLSVLSGNSHTN